MRPNSPSVHERLSATLRESSATLRLRDDGGSNPFTSLWTVAPTSSLSVDGTQLSVDLAFAGGRTPLAVRYGWPFTDAGDMAARNVLVLTSNGIGNEGAAALAAVLPSR